jgi:hypothetical protein
VRRELVQGVEVRWVGRTPCWQWACAADDAALVYHVITNPPQSTLRL